MKIVSNHRKQRFLQGFTLIEMIGVLAVIAILASMLIPKIFEAINSARVNNAAVSYNSIKTAVMDHYGKYGAINLLGTTGVSYAPGTAQMANYDQQILLTEGLIDKPFSTKIGTNAYVQVVAAAAAGAAVTGTNAAYSLDGLPVAAPTNEANPATYVVEAVIQGVAIADANELSHRLDGTTLSQATGVATADLQGRVKYDPALGNPVEVHIYIAHR